MKIVIKKLFLLVLLSFSLTVSAQRHIVHPGLSYTQADIDRMRAMIAAKQEPFYSGFLAFKNSRYTNYGDYAYPLPTASNGEPVIWTNRQLWFETFGNIAFHNVMMWKLTGDNSYADKAVATLNRYIPVHSTIPYGTNCLDNSAASTLIEAAELLRDYSGWKAADQQGFKDFLVYPGYSTKEDYYAKYADGDTLKNRVTVYWNVFQGDPGRHGNQGLYGMRCLMAIGVFLDNDTIYERALRKLLSMKHRADDLPYPYGPRTGIPATSGNPDYYACWNQNPNDGTFPTLSHGGTWGNLTIGNKEDYGADDELQYWIYENGQCQEAARDQGHIMDGMGNMATIAKCAWNQGDDIYTQYDNRLLKGMIYAAKYNYSWLNNHIHHETYWQNEEDFEPTVENGQFLQKMSRNGAFKSLKINPYSESSKTWTRGKRYSTPVQMLMAYKVRLGLGADSLLWLQRAYDMNKDSLTTDGLTSEENLTDYRTVWMAGDAGTFKNRIHVSGIPTMPATIQAADYDYFNNVVIGQGHTYYNPAERTDTLYRQEGGMQLTAVGDGYAVTSIKDGSWMNYTYSLAKSGTYGVSVNVRILSKGATIGFAVDGSAEQTVSVKPNSDYQQIDLGQLKLNAGASVLRIYVHGADDAVNLKSITMTASSASDIASAYVWNSRDYTPVSGAGWFLTDQSDTNLYTTSYTSTSSPTFTMPSSTLNYSVGSDQLYLVMEGKNLDHAAMKQAVYRLTSSASDVTKTSTGGQANVFKVTDSNTGVTSLIWKLDSTSSKRVTALMKDCYTSTSGSYVLRGLSFLVYGTSVHTSTSIDNLDFLTLSEIEKQYPSLFPTTGINEVKINTIGKSIVYDLQGRKVKTTTKGMYIVGNKKIIVD